MSEADVLDLLRQALWTSFVMAGPSVLAAMIIGLTVAVFQALTQVQESTLTFVPKMVAIVVVLVGAAAWIGGQLGLFTAMAYGRIVTGF